MRVFSRVRGERADTAARRMRSPLLSLLFGVALFAGCGSASSEATSEDEAAVRHRHDAGADASGHHALKTVFLVLMENHNWAAIKGNPSAPYINGTLLPMGSHAEGYVNVHGLHPSEPNYLWLEAGGNLGVTNDGSPSSNHQSTKSHLTTLLAAAGISWKAYAEGIDGTTCPLTTSGRYAPKHVPFVFFDDVTDTNSATSASCIAHVRPYDELAADLTQGTVARYNFITPDLCDDMHDSSGCKTGDAVKNGDTWLSHQLPKIFASTAYKDGGVVLVTWDESEMGDFPIGMIALSPNAKGHGYANNVAYSHSSTLRTMQEIFGVGPLLRDAAKAKSLSDLFTTFP